MHSMLRAYINSYFRKALGICLGIGFLSWSSLCFSSFSFSVDPCVSFADLILVEAAVFEVCLGIFS